MKRFWAVAGLSVALFVIGCVNRISDREAFAVGEITQAQRFTLQDLNGQSVSLDSVLKSNKAVLLNFWATWCPPCQEEIPGLIELQNKNKDKGFTVLGVDVGESQKKVSGFAQKVGINYPILLDKEMSAAENYKVVGIPTSILLDSSGKILGVYHSYSDALIRDVNKALA